jgi:hypothetical protein
MALMLFNPTIPFHSFSTSKGRYAELFGSPVSDAQHHPVPERLD